MIVKIDTAEAAQRLAAAIVSDVRLYNADAIKVGSDLSAEIGEARELYRSRVSPAFNAYLEKALTDGGLGVWAIDAGTAQPQVTPTASSSGSSANVLWFLVGLVGLAATIAWQLAR